MFRARVHMCVMALVCAGPTQAQEPALFRTPQMAALRDAERKGSPLLAAGSQDVAAARIRMANVATRGPVTVSLDLDEWNLTDPLSQTVAVVAEHEFLPKQLLHSSTARATALLSASEARLEGALIERMVELERHVAKAVLWRRIHARLAQEDSLLERASVTLSARFSIGDARYVDVIRLRTERIRVQTESADALAQSRAATRELVAIIGAGSEALVNDAINSITTLPVPQAPGIDGVIATAPVVRMAGAEIEMSRANLLTIRSEMAPRWTAGVGLQRFDTGSGFTVGPALTGSLTLPSFQKSVRSASTLAAAHDTLAAGGRYAFVIRRLRGEVASVEERLSAARDRFQGVDVRLLAAAREERESAIISYASGGLQLSDLLDFERTLARAEIQRLQSYLDIVDAWADLWVAVAGGNHEETD